MNNVSKVLLLVTRIFTVRILSFQCWDSDLITILVGFSLFLDSFETPSPKQQQTVNPCLSAPCTNGGTCVPFLADNYTCVCGVSDFGKHCEKCKHILIYLFYNMLCKQILSLIYL